jgi:hypothetical protein
MKTEEFLAWFDGFTRRIKGRPSAKDWQEIIAAIGRIESGSALKAWFEGLRVKVKGVPGDKEWREIKKRIDEERGSAEGKRRGLGDLFKTFEKKSGKLGDLPGAKRK